MDRHHHADRPASGVLAGPGPRRCHPARLHRGRDLAHAVFLTWIETSAMLEGRRFTRELQAQRQLAETAEASRYTELGTHLRQSWRRCARWPRTGTRLIARVDRAERTPHEIEQSSNTLSAYFAELEDRLNRGERPAHRARTRSLRRAKPSGLVSRPDGGEVSSLRLGTSTARGRPGAFSAARLVRRWYSIPTRGTTAAVERADRGHGSIASSPKIPTDRYRHPNDAAASGPGSRHLDHLVLRLTIQ